MVCTLAPSAFALGELLQIAIRQQSRQNDSREYYPFGKACAYLLLISFSFIRLCEHYKPISPKCQGFSRYFFHFFAANLPESQ